MFEDALGFEFPFETDEETSLDLFDAFDIESLDGFNPDILDNDGVETRIMQPRIKTPVPISFKFARRMAEAIQLTQGAHYYGIVSGQFIFGDLLESLIVDGQQHIKNMDIATLSVSQDNVDSLRTIMDSGFCLRLSLIVSHYFFSHERQSLIPYIYRELGHTDDFQLSVAGSHCKIACFETFEGLKFTIHGSANLRSSSNTEQFSIVEDPAFYDFNMEYINTIHDHYKTINHNIEAAKALGLGTIAGRGKSWPRVQGSLKKAAQGEDQGSKP
jgi:hypothetical protein